MICIGFQAGARFLCLAALFVASLLGVGCSTSIHYPREEAVFDDSPLCLWHGERTRTKVVHRVRMLGIEEPTCHWRCPGGHAVSGTKTSRDVRRQLERSGLGGKSLIGAPDDFDWYRVRFVSERVARFEAEWSSWYPLVDRAAIVIGLRPTVFVVVDRPAPEDAWHKLRREFDQVRGRSYIHLPGGVMDGTRLPIIDGGDSHLARVRVGVVGHSELAGIDARRPGEVEVGGVLVKWVMHPATDLVAPPGHSASSESPEIRWVEFLANRVEEQG